MNINMSAKYVLDYVKMINDIRATVYQIAVPYDSKVAILNLSRKSYVH